MPKKIRVLILAATAGLGACSLGGVSRPVQYYTLSPLAAEAPAASGGAQRHTIGVGPVSLPELFDRPQIVSRPDANRVELAEYDRWGSGLSQNVQHVLVQNLVNRLGNDNITGWPWQRRRAPELQVTVQFFRFDGMPGSQAFLSGTWEILDVGAGCSLDTRRFDITRAPDGPGYEAFVAALSQGLAQLSQEIAGRIAASPPGCAPGVSEPADNPPGSRTD